MTLNKKEWVFGIEDGLKDCLGGGGGERALFAYFQKIGLKAIESTETGFD